ncbi:MAG: SusC/RagA family TonB-linked outer membrane protein, partial [Tannerella sp.]|nr:SusC/RagA family TonB-linked outer membrane protein [Tannerella sp.]
MRNMRFLKFYLLKVVFLLLGLSFTGTAIAQNEVRKDILLNKVKITELVKKLGAKYPYSFFIADKEISEITVSVDIKNATVEQVLTQAFSGKNLSFSKQGKNITISSKQKQQSVTQQPSATQKTVSGTITDAKGEGIIGASVSIKGTGFGGLTDTEGNFSIDVPGDGGTLLVTYLGFLPQEVGITNQSSVNVVLEEDLKTLEEVVVIGYGTQKKSDLTGSVASVKMRAINDIPANSIEGLLQGRAAGLQVMNPSQDPASGAIIRIRGNSSLRGSNTPLIVLNGFPLGDAGNLSQINPANIESIEVLKDASASAIYGSRGANGVILITTKTAGKGITTVQVKHQTVVSQLTDKVDVWYDPMLMAQVANEEQINAGLTPPYIGQTIGGIYYPSLMEIQSGQWANTDWVDLSLRTPIVNSTTVAINSANDRSSFNLNAGYWDDEGIYKKDSYRKFNSNIDLSYKLLSNVKLSLFSVLSIGDRNISNGLEYGRNPLWPVYDENGDYFRAGPQDFGHPLIALRDIKNTYDERDFVNSFAVEWDIISGLKLRSQLNYRYKNTTGDVYRASTTSQDAFNNNGIAQINTTMF